MEKKKTTLILSRKAIQEIVIEVGLDEIMDQLIAKFEGELLSFDKNETMIPIRSGFNYTTPNPGLVEWMPLHSKGDQVSIKVVGYHPKNPINFDLPTILSTISSYDTNTGHLISLMDGVLLTALRTGAASAVASKYMASENSKILGLIGCGAQAISQLHAISRIFKLEKVLIYDIDSETVSSFTSRCSSQEYSFEIAESSIEEIVAHSDIVCTATSIEPGEGPLFKNLSSKPTVHVNAIGSDFPGKIELPMDLLDDSFVCPDFLDQALIEGECQRLETNQIGTELVDVVKNQESYSYVKNQRSVFDSTGWALEDKVVMDLMVELAIKHGFGEELEIEIISEDSKDPYGFMEEFQLATD